ncbi:hypothetical protein VE25_19550 [Devosia geojensis]|uniref:Uncharacterized protein n=1 Tax=Devosia geojensis TaxID=443610 RepID=A0A0F5FFU8_9HYPH|nr:glycosyltransferase family 39 protein [Devosia geojensis]KKB07047.1 hypothetical protein VE25_19550 [Devosia geojensis]
MHIRRIAISIVLLGLALAVLAALALAVMRETPGTNTYAQLAASWLQGRLDTAGPCFDNDCALFEGRTYIIFPPMPAVIALPFVALFGIDFQFFVPLSLVAFALTGLIWWRIGERETGNERDLTALMTLLVLFATPLAFVTLRGDHVWFFAQSWGVLFSSAAIYFALKRNVLAAGLFIGMAFLCRQMTILYLPFLYVLLLDRETPLFRIDMAAIKRGFSLAAVPILAVLIYFAYNYARFGSIGETGYSFIFPAEFDAATTSAGDFLQYRVRELGIFAPDYFLFNFIYMFIAGPHVEFAGRYMTQMSGFDINGASLFLVTPVLLLALLAPWNRAFWFGLGTCAVILGLTLLYHSNGFSQYSAQRYALDWLPVLLVLLLRGIKREHVPVLSILIAYSMMVTLAMIVFGGILGNA